VFSADSLNYVTLDFEPVNEKDIIDVSLKNHFSVYPNPLNSDLVNIKFNQFIKSDTTIEVFNVKGQRIEKYSGISHLDNISFNDLQLQTGIYFIKVSNEGFSQIKRVIVMK
jgi:hypothetical protein